MLADLHFKDRFWPFHQPLVRKINRLRPHLILFAGDLPYLYVSEGFGIAVAPFRIGARPEITLFLYGV